MSRPKQSHDLSIEALNRRSYSFILGDLVGWNLHLSFRPSFLQLIEDAILATKEHNTCNFCLGMLYGMRRIEEPEYCLSDLERRAA